MPEDWTIFFKESLAERSAAGLLRIRGACPSLEERAWIDFGSNDYLGLRTHPRVLEVLQGKTALGSGASPILTGHTATHRELEERLAELNDQSAALAFSSGFACNSGIVACLAGAGDLILSDELNHASLIDGCRLSRATTHVFPHNDAEYVADFLSRQRRSFQKVLVLTESVFSMDGDVAPLVELSESCARFQGGLVVDEAHATGVYGARGAGLVEELGLEQQVLAKLGTLSKAVGAIGGYVVGSTDLVEYLVNACRSYMFSTAPPPAIMAAATVAIEVLESMHQERRALRQTSRGLRSRLRELGWQVDSGDSPIVPVIVGEQTEAVRLSDRLLGDGLYVPAIRPPTVPAGRCRLRISLSVSHTQEQVDGLVRSLGRFQAD